MFIQTHFIFFLYCIRTKEIKKYFFTIKLNMRKPFSLVFFSPNTFQVQNKVVVFFFFFFLFLIKLRILQSAYHVYNIRKMGKKDIFLGVKKCIT